MKTISWWGFCNPRKAILVIAIGQILLTILGIWLGVLLFLFDVSFPPYFEIIAATLICGLLLFYPIRKCKSGIFKISYTKQKIFDGLIYLFTCLLIVLSGNKQSNECAAELPKAPSLSLLIVHKIDNHQHKGILYFIKNYAGKKIQGFKKTIGSELREVKTRFAEEKEKMEWVGILLIILTILLSIILGFHVFVLACAIYCQGHWAVAVIFFGLGQWGIVSLITLLCRKIVKRSRAKRANRGKEIIKEKKVSKIKWFRN